METRPIRRRYSDQFRFGQRHKESEFGHIVDRSNRDRLALSGFDLLDIGGLRCEEPLAAAMHAANELHAELPFAAVA